MEPLKWNPENNGKQILVTIKIKMEKTEFGNKTDF